MHDAHHVDELGSVCPGKPVLDAQQGFLGLALGLQSASYRADTDQPLQASRRLPLDLYVRLCALSELLNCCSSLQRSLQAHDLRRLGSLTNAMQ